MTTSKIAITLNAFLKFEIGEAAKHLQYLDDDIKSALEIFNTYSEQSLLMFNNFPIRKKVRALSQAIPNTNYLKSGLKTLQEMKPKP